MMSSISNELNEQDSIAISSRQAYFLYWKDRIGCSCTCSCGYVDSVFHRTHQRCEGKQRISLEKTEFKDVMNAVINIVAAAVTIVVVAIPEGLPLAVTLTPAFSMRRMLKDNAMKAGVNVKMVTGDNVDAERAIAIECGNLNPDVDFNNDGAVIEGVQFRNFSDEETMAKVESIQLMARFSPFDKLLMVQRLKQKGDMVAVTADGTNAPALKAADAGLSMGIQGTEVAKESSDIVILVDNFPSVVIVLIWGRCVHNNIQKSFNFSSRQCCCCFFSKVPLTTVQRLWVNLIMDTLGVLALATEQPTNDLMKNRLVG
ncbi:Calcium-transporting ATPase [Melia azedarach]|uniref:Calcium-transporting ATPase n=1 Tax=Melia azedarach TaxID=155640 RepID=A0ACC1YIR3_MELAZ|nr:Calcium-transporting ATPase [Melia azedarach]